MKYGFDYLHDNNSTVEYLYQSKVIISGYNLYLIISPFLIYRFIFRKILLVNKMR
jgi:hypothetical protein